MWQQILTKLRKKAKKDKDKSISNLIKKIEQVPRAIQEAVLHYYLRKCRNLYSLAYYQWRFKYRPLGSFGQAGIADLIRRTAAQFESDITYRKCCTSETVKASVIPKDMVKRYKLLGAQPSVHQVKSLDEIGMQDPYVEEAQISRSDCPSPGTFTLGANVLSVPIYPPGKIGT